MRRRNPRRKYQTRQQIYRFWSEHGPRSVTSFGASRFCVSAMVRAGSGHVWGLHRPVAARAPTLEQVLTV